MSDAIKILKPVRLDSFFKKRISSICKQGTSPGFGQKEEKCLTTYITKRKKSKYFNQQPCSLCPVWILVAATPGHFFQPGKNSLSLKQLAGLPKTPWRDLPILRG
jgi:hypothetical protein